mgnify:CR=1 FL=1
MTEYLYDAIRAVASQDIVINAFITDDSENVITKDCNLVLHGKDSHEMLTSVKGVYLPESLMWEFTIPAAATIGLLGRYWYCIQHENSNLCFKQPLYLV